MNSDHFSVGFLGVSRQSENTPLYCPFNEMRFRPVSLRTHSAVQLLIQLSMSVILASQFVCKVLKFSRVVNLCLYLLVPCMLYFHVEIVQRTFVVSLHSSLLLAAGVTSKGIFQTNLQELHPVASQLMHHFASLAWSKICLKCSALGWERSAKALVHNTNRYSKAICRTVWSSTKS